MAKIHPRIAAKAILVTVASTAASVLISALAVPLLGGSYDGIGMWLSILCPICIALPASIWQFHQSETLRRARDELSSLHLELDRTHSSLMQAHAALQERIRYDAMTGGLTREAFFAEMARASTEGRTGAFLVADADHFKRINDDFGHQTGDEALVVIASSIASTLGVRDFWGRIGGEEFAIFLDGSDRSEAVAVAETIRRKAETTEIRRETGRVPISVSIGGVCLGEGFSTHQSMGDADRRLYRAKRGGRNRVVLDEAHDKSATAA